jgi:hypothetical protein
VDPVCQPSASFSNSSGFLPQEEKTKRFQKKKTMNECIKNKNINIKFHMSVIMG